MPSLAAYQTTYLHPATGTVKGLTRLELAGLVYRLTEAFRMGATAAQAQAWVSAHPQYSRRTTAATAQAAGALTDLQAITTP